MMRLKIKSPRIREENSNFGLTNLCSQNSLAFIEESTGFEFESDHYQFEKRTAEIEQT